MKTTAIGILLCCLAQLCFSQGTFTSRTNGNWSASSTWTLSSGTDVDGVPDANDDAIFATGFRVDMDVDVAITNMTFNGTGRLDFNNNRTLSVGGDIIMNGNSSITGNNNNQILNLTGNFTIPAGQIGTLGGIRLTQTATSTFTISGTFIPSSSSGTKTLGNVVMGTAGSWAATSGETYSTQNFTMSDGAIIDGNSTSTININGNLLIQAGLAGSHSKLGRITMNITGTTTINGYLEFANSASGTKTFNNTITVNFGGTFDNIIGEDPVINCSIVNNGTWPAPTGGTGIYAVKVAGTYNYSGTSEISVTQLSVESNSTVTNTGFLTVSRNNPGLAVSSSGDFINGNGGYLKILSGGNGVDLSGLFSTIDFSTANNTVEYALSSAAQNIYATTYDKLIVSNGNTKSLVGSTTVNTTVTVEDNSILNAGGNTFDGGANLIMTGTSELQLGKSLATLPELTGVSNSLAAGTTITFNGTVSQTAKSSVTYPYQNINLSGTNVLSSVNMSNVTTVLENLNFSNRGAMNNNPVMTVVGNFNYAANSTTTLANNITVGNFITSNGTLNYSGLSITVNGNDGTWTNNGGAFTTNSTSLVVFTAGTNQLITGTEITTFRRLEINNAEGISLSGIDAQVQNSLVFTDGNLFTGTNNVYVLSGATVSPTNGFVEGNLKKDVVAGSPTVTYEVGTGDNYAPVNLAFTTVSSGGTVTVSSTSGDHPDINGSNIEPNRSINRYWTITNNATTFVSYSATFNFTAADFDALADYTNFSIKRMDGLNWNVTTTGTRTSTSTQFTGEVASKLPNGTSQDFQCGELINTTGISNRLTGTNNWSNQATWIRNRTGTIQLTNGSTAVTGTGTLFLTELSDGDVIMLQTSPATTYVVLSRASNTSLTLAANAATTLSGGYGKQYVPNTINDVVSIGNSNLTDATTTINLDMTATINALNINAASSPRATAQILTHQGTNTLNIQTNAIVYQPGADGVSDAWNINAGTAVIGGNLTLGSLLNNATRVARVAITSGTLTVTNIIFNITNNGGVEAAAVIDMSGGDGLINLNGSFSFTNSRGTLISKSTGTGSSVNFKRAAGSQAVNFPTSSTAAFIYNNIYTNNGNSAGVLLSANITTTNVTGNVEAQTGVLRIGSNTMVGNASRTFRIFPGATFRMTGTQPFPTGFGTFDLGTTAPFGTVQYMQTNNQTIAARSYGDLDILTAPNFTLPAGTTTIAGSLTVGNAANSTNLLGNGSVLTVTRDVTLTAGAEINMNNITTLNVGGNWTNDGTFTQSNNTVVFTGTGPTQPQVVGGSVSETFYNLTLNTASATNLVQLSKSTSVSQTLTLTQGGLDLNGQIINVTRNNTAAVVRTSGYIKSETTTEPYGELNWTTGTTAGAFVFPFGKSSTEYVPFTFNITAAGSPAAGSVSIATYGTGNDNTPYPTGVTHMNPGDNTPNVVDRFWYINLNNYTTTRPTATITFTATAGEVGTITNLQAQRWNSTGYWEAPASGQSNTAVSATVAGISVFSPWTLSGNNSPLPVELINFKAFTSDEFVFLTWSTATEINNDYFTIQRSMDGRHFQDVKNIDGAGTSTKVNHYSGEDNSPFAGTSYYRLKQTDFDGGVRYSQVISVTMPEYDVWFVYPNPGDGNALHVRLSREERSDIKSIHIYDIKGNVVGTILPKDDTERDLTIDFTQKLVSGVYMIGIHFGSKTEYQRFIVK